MVVPFCFDFYPYFFNFLFTYFLFYFFIFYRTCIDSSFFFLKLMQQSCINMFKLLLLLLLLRELRHNNFMGQGESVLRNFAERALMPKGIENPKKEELRC